MKNNILILSFILFSSWSFAQQPTVCQVFRAIYMDGKNAFSTFYGPNDGALGYDENSTLGEGFNFNNLKEVRKDMLTGEPFESGTIMNLNIGEMFEDTELMNYYLWIFQLNSKAYDYSTVPDSLLTDRLTLDLESHAKQLYASCFSDLVISKVSTSEADNSTNEIARMTISTDKDIADSYFNPIFEPFSNNLTISIHKDTSRDKFYYVQYSYYYPLEGKKQ